MNQEFKSPENTERILSLLTKFFYEKQGVKIVEKIPAADLLEQCVGIQETVGRDSNADSDVRLLNLQVMTVLKRWVIDRLNGNGNSNEANTNGNGNENELVVEADSEVVTSDDYMSEELFQAKLTEITRIQDERKEVQMKSEAASVSRFLMCHGKDRAWWEDEQRGRNPFKCHGTERIITLVKMHLPGLWPQPSFCHVKVHVDGVMVLECPMMWTQGSYVPVSQKMGLCTPLRSGDWQVGIWDVNGELLQLPKDGHVCRWNGTEKIMEIFGDQETKIRPGEDHIVLRTHSGQDSGMFLVDRCLVRNGRTYVTLRMGSRTLPDSWTGICMLADQQPFLYFEF